MRRYLLSGSWLALSLAACVDEGGTSDDGVEQRNLPLLDGDCLDASCCPAGLTVIEGSSSGDLLFPSAPDVCVLGKEGGDLIIPQAGHGQRLVLLAGPGGDQIHSPTIGAELYGGSGGDNIYGSPADDFIDTGPGADQGFGYGGADVLQGSDDDDVLYGGSGPDNVSGGSGDDTIFGDQDNLGNHPADDTLKGGLGNDTVHGNGGDDTIAGGPGLDSVSGNDGDDTFVIGHACEIEIGETIDGGPGLDTIESPYTAAELTALGVSTVSVESFVVTVEDPSRCESQPPSVWQTESTSGVRFRRTTPYEELANGWPEGSFLLEWTLSPDGSGEGSVVIPTSATTAVPAHFVERWAEEGIVVAIVDLDSDRATTTSPVFRSYFGELDGETAVDLVRADTTSFSGTLSAGSLSYKAREPSSAAQFDLSIPPAGPVTLLAPTSEPARAGDLADPALRPPDRVYDTAIIGEIGFCSQFDSDKAATELYDILKKSREDLLTATSGLPGGGLWLRASFFACYRLGPIADPINDPLQCTRILDTVYQENDAGVMGDINRLPIVDGTPLINTSGNLLGPECSFDTELYPYADCGYPAIDACMRDRGWGALQSLKTTGVIPLLLDPDLIQTVHSGTPEGRTAPISSRDRGFFQTLQYLAAAPQTARQGCGIANQPGFDDTQNASWIEASGADECIGCPPLPPAGERKKLSAISQSDDCNSIVSAHEFGHNFEALHPNPAQNATPPAGWDGDACVSGQFQTLMTDGQSAELGCRVPVLTSSNAGIMEMCASQSTCQQL